MLMVSVLLSCRVSRFREILSHNMPKVVYEITNESIYNNSRKAVSTLSRQRQIWDIEHCIICLIKKMIALPFSITALRLFSDRERFLT